MKKHTSLEICLAWQQRPPVPGDSYVDLHRGGPEVLLNWLETQLGLPPPRLSRVLRAAVLHKDLTDCPRPSFAASFTRDGWATAFELLARLDGLMLAGWDGASKAALPPIVNDLSEIVGRTEVMRGSEAWRIKAILGALETGQTLPPHECKLLDPKDRWPPMWRRLLDRLSLSETPPQTAMAPAGSGLASAQAQMLGDSEAAVAPDASLRWVTASCAIASCEAAAAAMAQQPEYLSETVVCCADDGLLAVLDGALARRGLPTGGTAIGTTAHPALEVLPLVLRLCWEPVNPALLMDFLSLPINPLPQWAARKLAEALTQQPGLGSGAWQKNREALCSTDRDPDGEVARRLALWFDAPRQPRGEALPSAWAVERCRTVAQWAQSRAAGFRSELPDLATALLAASQQATALADLVADGEDSITEPQLGRLLSAVSESGVSVRIYPQLHGGPHFVSGLEKIETPVRRLVWLGLSAGRPQHSQWTRIDREALVNAGIHIDDGSPQLESLRAAERRGLALVSESLLAIELARDQESPPHPVWMQVKAALTHHDDVKPPVLERLLTGGYDAIAPWQAPLRSTAVATPQPPPQHWQVAPGLIEDRRSSSATELVSRLGCPLKWVFHYSARLLAGAANRLPGIFRLKGLFGHAVLAEVFSTPELPSADQAAALAGEIFDNRVSRDAAPLAQPALALEMKGLRADLCTAARVLARLLAAGGYRVAGMEHRVTGSIDGRTLNGAVDCLAVRPDGAEAVVDLKYMGVKKYRDLLQQGHAVQLATYAEGRHQETGRWPAVAYLILSDGQWFTPAGSSLVGTPPDAIVDGPGIREVWAGLSSAMTGAEGWMKKGQPIPVRPLQDKKDRPAGSEMVITDPAKGKGPADAEPCKYCDFGLLCGALEVL